MSRVSRILILILIGTVLCCGLPLRESQGQQVSFALPAEDGPLLSEKSFVPELVTVLQHRIWLAVREGAVAASDVESLSLDRVTNILTVQERGRKERLAAAAGQLALAWIDELLFIPEADREAWLRILSGWGNEEEFIRALEQGRKLFLNRLPGLSLPDVDSSLIHSEVQGQLGKWLFTGKFFSEKGAADNRFAHLPPQELIQVREQLLRDCDEGKIEREEGVRQLRLVEEVETNRLREGFGDEGQRAHRMVLKWFERQAEVLDLPFEKRRQDYLTVVRETAGELIQNFERDSEDRDHWSHSDSKYPGSVGLWVVDPGFLGDHSRYQEALFEILASDAWTHWRADRRRRRAAQTEALKEYALAKADSRLFLIPAQLEQAKAVALAYDPEETLCLEELQAEADRNNRWLAVSSERNPGEHGLIADILRQIVSDLDAGFMTSWQRRVAAEILQVAEP